MEGTSGGTGFDVGARLRTLREKHELSQRELAKRAGVSNAIISLIEQNRTSPSVGSLKKVLDGLPISLAEFFAMELPSRPQLFFEAAELVEIAGGTSRDGRCRFCTSATPKERTPARSCCATNRRRAGW
jgi:transcriptional regulator with XRE-family HTH domain